jgi:hypothetical protein
MPHKPTIIATPDQGVSDAAGFIAQSRVACPPDGMVNIVPVDTGTGAIEKRFRLATRPPLKVLFGQTSTGAVPIRDMGRVGQASAFAGYNLGTVTTSTPNNTQGRESGQLRANFFILDPDWSIARTFADNRASSPNAAPPSSQGGAEAYACCFDPDDDDIAYGGIFTVDTARTTQSVTLTGLSRFNIASNAITHTQYVVDTDPGYSVPYNNASQGGTYANKITCKKPYLYVVAGSYLYIFTAADSTYIKRYQVPFAIEAQDCRVATINGTDYLSVAFTGSTVISGPVVADAGADPRELFGEHFRSGFALYKINYGDATTKTAVAVNADPITRIAMPQGTQNGDGGYENHRTFRIAEYCGARPRGALVYSHAIAADGSVYVGRCNQGFGYDGSQTAQQPFGTPYVTVCKANITAALATNPAAYIAPATPTDYGILWERDTDSFLNSFSWNGQTWYNDIPAIVSGARVPGGNTEYPSVFAVEYSPIDDLVVVGGRRPSPNQARSNIYALQGSDGGRVWSQDVKGAVQQNAIALNPANGNFVVGFTFNNGYPDAGGQYAEVVELNKDDGTIVHRKHFVFDNGWMSRAEDPKWSAGYSVACNKRGQTLVACAPFRYLI